jgi:hypothetical protein
MTSASASRAQRAKVVTTSEARASAEMAWHADLASATPPCCRHLTRASDTAFVDADDGDEVIDNVWQREAMPCALVEGQLCIMAWRHDSTLQHDEGAADAIDERTLAARLSQFDEEGGALCTWWLRGEVDRIIGNDLAEMNNEEAVRGSDQEEQRTNSTCWTVVVDFDESV